MLKKLWLCHNVNKLYKIFGEALEVYPCKTRLRDIFDDKVYPIDR